MQLNPSDSTRQPCMPLGRILKGGVRLLLLIQALVWMQLAAAQTASFQVGTKDRYELSRAFAFLEDTSGAYTLEDVLQPGAQARFQAVLQGVASTNFGTTNSAI
jgi:hypothetical protein